ncbi:MAG: amidohydrolase family protein [Anaerolineales bacterium]|nr:amidohydrolase family protein [Anaerolineales bacterium]
MADTYDLLIRDAQLRGRPGRFAIGVRAGQIAAVAEQAPGAAALELDAAGGLVTESFVNPHLHLCKVHTRPLLDEEALRGYHAEGMGQAMNTIELAARVKEHYAEAWLIKNVRRAVAEAALHGNLHIRALADVDPKARLEGLRAVLRAREEFQGLVDLQVCAFAQDGLAREPGAGDLMRQAMALGADVAGGIPWIEYTDADLRAHVREIFDLAQQSDKDVSMLVDDAGDPGLRSLEVMAVEAIQRGWRGRALAHHARAMALYPEPYFQKVAALLKQADLAVVTDPHTGPLHARVKDLLAAGVTVALGQDDISDGYYPFGRNNLLEVAFLAAHLLWMTTNRELETLYDMITVNAARAMNVRGHGLRAGAPANLVVLAAPSVLEALRAHAAPRFVISHGRLVDRARLEVVARTGEWPA